VPVVPTLAQGPFRYFELQRNIADLQRTMRRDSRPSLRCLLFQSDLPSFTLLCERLQFFPRSPGRGASGFDVRSRSRPRLGTFVLETKSLPPPHCPWPYSSQRYFSPDLRTGAAEGSAFQWGCLLLRSVFWELYVLTQALVSSVFRGYAVLQNHSEPPSRGDFRQLYPPDLVWMDGGFVAERLESSTLAAV